VLVDRYRVIRKIGAGGFGSVYLARDDRVDEELILKILSPSISSDEVAVQRFVQELKVTRRISHKNVIRLYDFIDLGAGHAISMEYFDGRDLAKILTDQGKLEPDRGLRIVGQILEGLVAAHAEGIVHRDIKPPNVLVGADDMVKVLDFGLASMTESTGSGLTKTGMIIGTPHYMSPEQIKGEVIDARADLYALGVMMFELFTGSRPFDADTAVKILYKHLEGKPPRLPDRDWPEGLPSLVRRAMARRRDQRPASAHDMLQEIEDLAA